MVQNSFWREPSVCGIKKTCTFIINSVATACTERSQSQLKTVRYKMSKNVNKMSVQSFTSANIIGKNWAPFVGLKNNISNSKEL